MKGYKNGIIIIKISYDQNIKISYDQNLYSFWNFFWIYS